MVNSLSRNFFRGLLAGLFHLKTGNAAKANQILAAYEAVTEADILRVARTYLTERQPHRGDAATRFRGGKRRAGAVGLTRAAIRVTCGEPAWIR